MYQIEKAYNDFGTRISNVGLVGKTEVTILDNLYRVAQLLHGRILTSSTILGGFRVYITRQQLVDLISAYTSILPYQLSPELDPLIASLRALLTPNTIDVEVGIDSRIILQAISVHNVISIKLKEIWEGVVGLRFISASGSNKDVTIDGKQQILDQMIAKFTDGELKTLSSSFERAGQLAGIKSVRQVEMRDMIADLLFSRKDSYVTLHQLFHTMKKQRHVLREFRTDILFCPVDRYRELDSGFNLRVLVKVDKQDDKIILKPKGFDYAEFVIRNTGLDNIDILIAGSIGSGAQTILPLQSVHLSGTSISFAAAAITTLDIVLWSDIRSYIGSGPSIVSLATDGKLKSSEDMTNVFFQVIRPILQYLPSFTTRIHHSEILKTVISKFPAAIVTLFDNLQPGSIYGGWLLEDVGAKMERIAYIYMLVFMLPEFLLDATFTFSDTNGTPPYVHEYAQYMQGLKTLFD